MALPQHKIHLQKLSTSSTLYNSLFVVFLQVPPIPNGLHILEITSTKAEAASLRRCFINNYAICSLFLSVLFFVYLVASINKLELEATFLPFSIALNSSDVALHIFMLFSGLRTSKQSTPNLSPLTYRTPISPLLNTFATTKPVTNPPTQGISLRTRRTSPTMA